MKNIKPKIKTNHIIITKEDKRNTTVIIREEDYNKKIDEFIIGNNFTKLTHDITNTLQKRVRNGLNNSRHIINKDEKWTHKCEPKTPTLHATVKLHETGNPIRPIVSWKECPIYELAKALNNVLRNKLELRNAFNVTNSRALTQELANMEVGEHTQLCSFHIENMYTNIPISRCSATGVPSQVERCDANFYLL
jgi:hypothetical protein